MKDQIIKEQLFNHPIEKIWKAISIGEEISTWFIPADFKAEKGYHYTFNAEGGECSAISGEVLEADPYTLSYTWIVTDSPARTVVTWKLSKVEAGTLLYLEHSGISNYEGDTAIEMFTSFNGGWDNCLNGLVAHLKNEVHAG